MKFLPCLIKKIQELPSFAPFITNPTVFPYDSPTENLDSDGDGLLNADEPIYGTDIYNKDTDGDGYYDGDEVKSGYNPMGSGKMKLF